MLIKLIESDATSKGVRAKIQLISAGLGSSGFYSEAVLQRDGATAFPAGTHLFFNHITENETWERKGSRDTRDIVGKTVGDAQYDPVTQGLWTEAIFYHSNAAFIKEIFEDIGISIEAAGSRDEESGEITALIANEHNRLALVPKGGRDGKILQFLESVKGFTPNLTESGKIELSDTNPEKDNHKMTPEDIKAVVDAVALALEPRFATIEESLKPVDAEPVVIADVLEAVIEADLSKELRARIYESADPMQELETIRWQNPRILKNF